MRRRAGYSLIEVVVAAGLLSAACSVAVPLYSALMSEVPAAGRMAQTGSAIGRMLQRIQDDVDASAALPPAAADRKAGPQCLLIRQPGGVVCWEFAEGRMRRWELLPGQAAPDPGSTETWPLPNARITFALLPGSDRKAVEVHSAVLDAKGEPRFKRADVFFLSAAGPEGGEQ